MIEKHQGVLDTQFARTAVLQAELEAHKGRRKLHEPLAPNERDERKQ
jgi:hypothetical protein